MACANKMFLNLLENIFASREANFVSATMSPEVVQTTFLQQYFSIRTNKETRVGNNISATMFSEAGKQGNIDTRKHNVTATIFLELDKQEDIHRKHTSNVSTTMFSEVGKHKSIERKHKVSATCYYQCFPR